MKKYKLSENLINEVLNYLSGKPFKEVMGLIDKIEKELIADSTSDLQPETKTEIIKNDSTS